jgi:hypothetical protein
VCGRFDISAIAEVADLDDRLVRRVVRAAQELRRERLERRVEIALPETVGLHRVEVAVEHAEPVLHDGLLNMPACGA